MKQVAGRIKLELAPVPRDGELRPVRLRSRRLDASVLLARGSRLTELLKQPQFSPLSVEEQVVSIFAGVRGYLDKIDIANVNRFEASLLAELRAKGGDILASIRDKRGAHPGERGEAQDLRRELRQDLRLTPRDRLSDGQLKGPPGPHPQRQVDAENHRPP